MNIPIRVLHVVTQMNRNGLESRIMDLYRNIDRKKVQFDFFTHRNTEGEFDKEIKELGGVIYYNSKLSPFTFVNYISRLNNFFDKKNYEIVHSHLNAASTWILWVAKSHGIDVRIAHSRNSGIERNWKSLFKIFSKLFINYTATHRFACSLQAGKWLFGKKNIQNLDTFKVIPNAIDTRKFTFSDSARKNTQKTLQNLGTLSIVHVGRLTYQKNHAFLLEIFNEILKIKPNAKLYLIGDGELKLELQEIVKKLNMMNKVVFLGSQKNVGEILQAMDVFIFPSHFEGFGTAVVEAQCIGVPVIASDSLPKEVKLTPILEFMNLKESASIWAKKAVEFSEIKRVGYEKEVNLSGFDVTTSYHAMEEFYINSL
jgi:glycosyltransferase involved in cell wall biosynthesis